MTIGPKGSAINIIFIKTVCNADKFERKRSIWLFMDEGSMLFVMQN